MALFSENDVLLYAIQQLSMMLLTNFFLVNQIFLFKFFGIFIQFMKNVINLKIIF